MAKGKKKKKENSAEVQDNLAGILAKSVNKKFKDEGHKVAYFIDTERDNPSNIKQWISTGCDMLDLGISNQPHGGLPVGRIVELQGLEGSGKSLLCAHIMVETQKLDGVVVYIDTEHAMDETFFKAIGIDFDNFLYLPISKLEDVFAAAEEVITKVRSYDKDVPVTICIDSIMGAKTQQEDEAEFGKDGYATQKAIIMSKAMRKITDLISWQKILFVCTNQLRIKMNAMFGDPYCVDPFTTKVKVRYKQIEKSVNTPVEEMTLSELSEKFLLGNDDFTTPTDYDLQDLNIEVLTMDSEGNKFYKPIKSFVVKPSVDSHYTDGKIKVTGNHRFVEYDKDGSRVEIFAKEHPEFSEVNEPLKVVDIEVEDEHTYLANGRLNHNTTSGGKALGFHSSVRLRIKSMGKIKGTVNGIEQIVGMKTRVQVIKNRLGPPHKVVNYNIYFDSGIDNAGGWLGVLKAYKIIKNPGAWYKYKTNDGEEISFQKKDFDDQIMSNEKLRQELYDKICEKYIMKYKPRVHGEAEVVDDNDDEAISSLANQFDNDAEKGKSKKKKK